MAFLRSGVTKTWLLPSVLHFILGESYPITKNKWLLKISSQSLTVLSHYWNSWLCVLSLKSFIVSHSILENLNFRTNLYIIIRCEYLLIHFRTCNSTPEIWVVYTLNGCLPKAVSEYLLLAILTNGPPFDQMAWVAKHSKNVFEEYLL